MQRNSRSTGKIIIRKARKNDYERVKELLVRSGQTTEQIFTRKRFENTLEDFNKYNLVAQKDNRLIGYIFGFDDSGKSGKPKFYGYLGRLIVDPEYRYMGIGNTLVEGCLAEFKKSGYKIVFAGVHRLNVNSRSLFEKKGFRNDDLLLLRFLDL